MTRSDTGQLSQTGVANWQGLSIDAVFDALAHQYRRSVLYSLKKNEHSIPVADLATELAALEHETTNPEFTATDGDQIYTSLVHSHIPKLADAGLITYNQDRNIVTLTDPANHLIPFLSRITDEVSSR